MRALYLVIVLSILSLKCGFSQESGRRQVIDTLVTEEIVYEVDTVYLHPDTINLMDTVVHFIRQPKHPWFIEIAGSSFIGIRDFSTTDSLTVKKTLNYSAGITLAYAYKSVFWGLNVGITQLEDNISDAGISYASKTPITAAGFADSMAYSGACSFKNYYNYLNVGIVLGKKWKGGTRFSYRGVVNAGCDLLFSHSSFSVLSDANNKIPIPEDDLRELTFSFGLAASIDYKMAKKTDLFLSPYSKVFLQMNKSYPLSNFVILGVSVGVRKYF